MKQNRRQPDDSRDKKEEADGLFDTESGEGNAHEYIDEIQKESLDDQFNDVIGSPEEEIYKENQFSPV